MIPKIDLSVIEKLHAQCERRGVGYGLGAKADHLSDGPDKFSHIDCSGYIRVLLFHATNGALVIPDGSQNQREWAEKNLNQVGRYVDAASYMTGNRLFICFIKPHANGCGAVGHVWLLRDADTGIGVRAETVESHGGHGPNSRAWNTGVLIREVYSVFELPTA